MAKKERPASDPTRLTDAEADFALEHVEWALRGLLSPQVFAKRFGAGLVFGVTDEGRDVARELVRVFWRAER
jgi:hypothetical protein